LYLPELDILIPSKHFYQRHRSSQIQPEKRLMFAVLLDNIECFQNKLEMFDANQIGYLNITERWIFEDDQKWVFHQSVKPWASIFCTCEKAY